MREPDDELIAQAVAIHLASLDQGLLPSLGGPFLRRVYARLLATRAAFLVVAQEGSRLRGFILGAPDASAVTRAVAGAPHRFAAVLVPAVLRRPSLIVRFVETIAYGLRSADAERAELLVIAIEEGWRGKGIGRRMVEGLEAELRSRGIARYGVTVYRDMEAANRFYLRNGFTLTRSFRLYGVSWNRYERALAS